ncbi:FAS1-like dehydratase domain-containing protein [Antarctobacter sp.]|uniref:FAS1-like dehydratase domain-containing protein n=1 Tax=Antarctobacter sp. TaxID=1872577 RepID=UPI003A915C35
MADGLDTFDDWVGRAQQSQGILTEELVDRFCATLEIADNNSGHLPLGIHWCVGLDSPATSALGSDGHPPKGGFLPPVPFPRRMWASGQMTVLSPLRRNQTLTRQSRITAVTPKQGKSGNLCFVTVRHTILADDRPAIDEEQHIVYRDAANGDAPDPLPAEDPAPLSAGVRRLWPTETLLFRYSALTFNSHRIHYDQSYARDAESYPALVVHGPLQATLLADRAYQALGRPLTRFAFAGRAPAFVGAALDLGVEAVGPPLGLASRQFGKICMTAEAA